MRVRGYSVGAGCRGAHVRAGGDASLSARSVVSQAARLLEYSRMWEAVPRSSSMVPRSRIP
jgi:hypothetical protein